MALIKNEAEILDADKRKKIIDDIKKGDNTQRKDEAFKRYECLKDRTDYYVMQMLLRQFDATTVYEMQYAVTNVSFTKKIVEKLARVFSGGVKRSLVGTKGKAKVAALEKLAELLEMNQKMKKTNKYVKLFKNCLVFVKPLECEGKFRPSLTPMPPFLYDVIENPTNKQEPMVVILSDYSPSRGEMYAMNAAVAGRETGPGIRTQPPAAGTGQMAAVAGPPQAPSQKDEEYIWWSKNYHFTTNGKGEIIAPVAPVADVNGEKQSTTPLNPLGALPFVNFAEDQDDAFWAQGGGDIVDGGVKINSILTNIYHIGVQQGYGQLYMTGENLPKSIKVGPNTCIQLKQEAGGPEPKIGFLTANPPLGDLASNIEMYVALLLSTNNLSTSGVASNLNGGGTNFPSGVALLIDKSESMDDIGDQSQLFREREPKLWTLIWKWMVIYDNLNLLDEEFVEHKLPDNPKVTLTFPMAQVILSEQDRLDIITKRKEAGLNTAVELIMRDDPTLDEDEAQEKLKKILEDRLLYPWFFAPPGAAQDDGSEEDGEGEDPADPASKAKGKKVKEKGDPKPPAKAPGKPPGAKKPKGKGIDG